MDLKRSTMHLMILKCVRIALTSMLSRDIRVIMEHLDESKIGPVKYFTESSYKGGNGQVPTNLNNSKVGSNTWF